MIKQGSGIALCLKFVTTKAPSAPPFAVRRAKLALCAKSKLTTKSSSLLECFGSNGNPTLLSLPVQQTLIDTAIKQSKVIRYQCDSDVISYISYLIFDSKDTSTNSKFVKTESTGPPCQLNACVLGIPYNGTLDDLRPSHTFDLQVSQNLQNQKRHVHPGLEKQYSAPNSSKIDQYVLRVKNSTSSSQDPYQPPSEEQLAHVLRTLSDDLPRFFVKSLDYKIYHRNIVLEDNIRGKKFSGFEKYFVQSKLFYILGHIRFMYIKLDVLKITAHPDDGTVKVRWRVSVLKLRKLLKVKLWDFSASLLNGKETWIDGFSTYYVMGDGLVHRHVADKMIPDPESLVKKDEVKPILENPLAYSNRNKV